VGDDHRGERPVIQVAMLLTEARYSRIDPRQQVWAHFLNFFFSL
jgi:hypothetical protein